MRCSEPIHQRVVVVCFFFFQAEDGIRDYKVTGVQTCALPILGQTVQRGLQLSKGGAIHLFDDPESAKNLRSVEQITRSLCRAGADRQSLVVAVGGGVVGDVARSEEHTSELQSPCNLVCRLLLEKKTRRSWCHPASVPRPRSRS